jgi:uncharacterized membrane protein YdjX (TVP38/TMEM64 family)
MRFLGIIGTALGLILAIFGIYFLISAGSSTVSIVVLVVGVLLLALGAWAYRGSARTRSI